MTRLHWPARPQRRTCKLGRCLIWQADGGPYRVWKLDCYEARVYFAQRCIGDGRWRNIGRHRNPAAARRACEKHCRREAVAT